MNMSTLFILIMGMGIAIIGTYIFIDMMKKPVIRVDLLRPRDRRGVTLKVIEETDLGLFCKKYKGVTHRFIKVGSAWMFHEGGRAVTKFLGLEGTAYTALLEDSPAITNMPVSDYLRDIIWDKEFYDEIPDEQRQALEKDVIGVTIEIKEVVTEGTNLPPLSGEDIFDEEDSLVIKSIAKSGAQVAKGASIMQYGLGILLGALMMYMAIMQGLI